MKYLLSLFTASLAVLVPQAQAADEVRLLTPVTYAEGGDIPDAVKSDCRSDVKLQEQVAEALRRYNHVLDTTDTLEGRVLRLTIMQIHANPGAAFTGPKSLSARAELLENGKVVNSTLLHSGALSIPMISFRSTCSILNKAMLKMAQRAATWVRNPRAATAVDEGSEGSVEAIEAAASAASR
jgi:hypothetical protein